MTQDIAGRGKRKGKRGEVRVRNGKRRVEKEKGRKRDEERNPEILLLLTHHYTSNSVI